MKRTSCVNLYFSFSIVPILLLHSSFQISELERQKEDFLICMYLFIGAESLELDKSINHQLAQSERWSKSRTPKKAVVGVSPSEDTG